jgi:hypothetical protein
MDLVKRGNSRGYALLEMFESNGEVVPWVK